jgi:hypothetical protein
MFCLLIMVTQVVIDDIIILCYHTKTVMVL